MNIDDLEPIRKSTCIYLVLLDGHLKLGCTSNLEKRLRSLGEASVRVQLLESVPGNSRIEKELHSMFGGGVRGLYDFDYEQEIREAMHSICS